MASCNEEFNQYHEFLQNIAKSVNNHDSEVPVKLTNLRNSYYASDAEGEVIYWMLKFLNEKKCPTKLTAPILRNALIEIQNNSHYKDPKREGLHNLRALTMSILEGFCVRLKDNVELNKILDTATSRSAQQLTDDLLTIPIRTSGACINRRSKMEDRSICIDEFHQVYRTKDPQKSSFYGVFDGHNGYVAAQYAAVQLPYNLSVHSADPIYSLRQVFEYTDKQFVEFKLPGGTTVTCALYRPEERRLYVAWVGDSKAMLAKKHGKIMQLVTPHRLDSESEKKRIQLSGGTVHCVQGEYRVNGCINLTRSIGDANMKRQLIGTPDCVVVELDKQEEFLVLATDGLFDHASDCDIARTVYDCIKEDCENLDQIPNRLIKLAQDGKSTDNISVIVVFFKHPSQIAKNCENLTIMESEFDNIKQADYYSSTNYYASEEDTTSTSPTIVKQMRWGRDDDMNNIINEEAKQTTMTTTTTTTTTSTNNGQFDDNLLYCSDNMNLSQKIQSTVDDDNILHRDSTVENNGDDEFLAAGYSNKNELLPNEYDNDQQKILAKNHANPQLADADADYGPETCVDVTDDVVMMTENSADTNNLLEQSTLSHSKDTLPSSDNCNPFDNKNALDMEYANEYQLGGGIGGPDAHLQLDDANKATPLLSPEVEDLPLSSDCGLQFTNEGFQQSPLDEEMPAGLESHQQQQVDFEDEFAGSNGHLSPPNESKDLENFAVSEQLEKFDVPLKADELEDMENLGKLQELDEDNLMKEEEILSSQQQVDFNADFLGSLEQTQGIVQQNDNIYDNLESNDNDESDFRLKDEEEILEKHVETSSFAEKHLEEIEDAELQDLNQRDELQQTLHNLEDDILEEKPILTGSFTEKQSTEINFDAMSMQPEDEKLNDFADEKQNREEFAEKESKVDEILEKLSFVEQKSAPSEDIELEEDECIHLEEDVRPSDYLAMLERQKEEQQQLSKVVECFERDPQDGDMPEKRDQPNIKEELEEDEGISESVDLLEKEELFEKVDNLEKPIFDEDDRLSDKVEQFAKEQNDRLSDKEEEQHVEDKPEQLQPKEDQQFDNKEELQPKEDQQFDNKEEQIIEKDDEHFDEDQPLSVETEQHEQERHLHDIEIMSEQFDRMEDAEQAEDRLNDQIEQQNQLEDERQAESFKNDDLYDNEAVLNEQIGQLEEIQKELELKETKEGLDAEFTPLTELHEGFNEGIEKLEDEILPQQETQEQLQFHEESLAEELKNKELDEDFIDEPEKQFVECTEKQLAKIEAQVLDFAPIPAERPKRETQPEEDFEMDYENMVEVVEEPIIKEQVPIKPSTLPVSAQEPSALTPTHESCDELENNEWKYMKEGQGEKQLLDLQGNSVVEEALNQKSQEDTSAFSIEDKSELSAVALTEQISSIATEQAESIKDTFKDLTQNIADLAESAAAIAENSVDKAESTLESLNLSQSSTREKLDNIDDEDLSASEMNSKLNPEAKEFVPTFSPTATIELANGFGIAAPTAIPQHFRDELLAQSPRKGRESDMEDINIPAENEFEEEIAHKPHGLPNDEAIVEQPENGGLYQEMNWKEAMHGSEKEEGPLVDSPLTEESLEIVDNALQYAADPNLLGFTAPVDLDNAGMKESIYIENNTTQDSNEEDILNTVQVLPVEDSESKDNSFEMVNATGCTPGLLEKDVVTKEEVEELLTLVSDEKKGNKVDEEIEQRMKELLLSNDNEITKEVQRETESVAINGVEMASASHKIEQSSVPQKLQEPSAPALVEGLALGAVAAAAVATTTAAVKKVEAEKNQKNLIKTSATKSKVPDTKKPTIGLTSKTSSVSSAAAKRSLGSDKPKSTVTSSLATKKPPLGGTTTSGAPRPRTAPAAAKVPADKKTTSSTSTTTTSTAKSRIDSKPPSTLTSRKPLTSSSASKANKSVEEPKSSSTTVKSSVSSKTTLASKSSSGASKPALTTHSITKPRPATASSATNTNGVATKTAASKPTTLASKSAATNSKPSLTSPRGTVTSTLRKTEAIKSPTKSTTSTTTSRVSSTNGTKSTTTTTRTTTSKTTLSTVPTTAARTTSTTTTRRPTTGTTTSTIGATTPTPKTNNLVPRKSTPLKKTSNSSTPTARKSIGSKLNASATKPTKDTSTPRPVTIPAHHQQQNHESKAAAELAKDVPVENGEPKINGIASSPDDVPSSPKAPVALPLEVEIA